MNRNRSLRFELVAEIRSPRDAFLFGRFTAELLYKLRRSGYKGEVQGALHGLLGVTDLLDEQFEKGLEEQLKKHGIENVKEFLFRIDD